MIIVVNGIPIVGIDRVIAIQRIAKRIIERGDDKAKTRVSNSPW
jgi:hypothetical protein